MREQKDLIGALIFHLHRELGPLEYHIFFHIFRKMGTFNESWGLIG